MANYPLSVSYTPEAKDYVRASRALAKKTTSFIIMAALLVLAMLGALVVLLVPSLGDQNWKNIALILLIVGIFYIVYYFAVIPWQLTRAYKKNEHLKVERTLIFTNDNIQVKVGEDGTILNWDQFQRVLDAKDFYLMVFKDRQKLYFFIPDRAFNEEVTKEAFVDLMNEKSITII
ncbi:MAG: YcxB family protein [Brevefilum sp.]|nr:YcxB family protein [Brevefilum sp.]